MNHVLKDSHKEAITAAIAANKRVTRAMLIGSRAMGTNTVTSDVDIVLFGESLTMSDRARLSAVMEALPLAQSVDLVLHNSIKSPAFLDHIRRHGVEWYRKKQEDWAS